MTCPYAYYVPGDRKPKCSNKWREMFEGSGLYCKFGKFGSRGYYISNEADNCPFKGRKDEKKK